MYRCRQRYSGRKSLGGGSGSGSSSEDIGKLTRKRLNRGLPGRKRGTVWNQLNLR